MSVRPVEIWFFYPRKGMPTVGQVRAMISAECEKRDWAFMPRPTELIKLQGRPIGRIERDDATNLYKRMHRARVGVWQLEYADVPRRPRPKETAGDYVALSRFVLHKAFHSKLPNNSLGNSWSSSLAQFLKWIEEPCCENEGDPRCLPFHVFDTRLQLDQLGSRCGRQKFAEIHGAQSSRVDSRGLRWTRGPYHGQDALQVAGCELTSGFHWDVDGKGKQRVTTVSDVWELRKGGYINIYPDAHIRQGNHLAKRIQG